MGYCNHGYDRKKLIGLSSVFSQNLGNSEKSPFFEYHPLTVTQRHSLDLLYQNLREAAFLAGGRIKGITIELGGDSTRLKTCLKNVNQEIRNTESKLKDVNKLLKMDPGNTNLLSHKIQDPPAGYQGYKRKTGHF